MSTTNLTHAPIKRRPLWRRILRWTVRTVIVLIVGFFVWHYVNLYLAKRELQQTIAELDKTDPKWRWKDLMAEWPDVPDEENGALVVFHAYKMLPRNWIDFKLNDKLEDIPPVLRFPTTFVCQIEEKHNELAEAVAEARKMLYFPQGKYQTKLTADVFSTLIPQNERSRDVAQLLRRDLWIALEKRDVQLAANSLQSLFHVGVTLRNEPIAVMQLVRMAIVGISIKCLERLLANGEPSSECLEPLPQFIADEIQHSSVERMMNGERAAFHILYQNLASGDADIAKLASEKADVTIIDRVGQFLAGPMIVRSNEFHLRFTTQMVNASRLPITNRHKELDRLREDFYEQKDMREVPDIARLLTPDYFKIVAADQRITTTLQCARAGVAAELFRLKNNRWPKSLDEMIKTKLLDELPIDHYTAKPVQMRHTKDGLVFYSPGPDGNYKGDALDDPYHPKLDIVPYRTRIEFRLWDVDKRRQPAPMIRDLEREKELPFPGIDVD